MLVIKYFLSCSGADEVQFVYFYLLSFIPVSPTVQEVVSF
uniref:Uncharacterized protein n=1 Tax=Rhizophora mucronata TaxID=61149 RepID=A0A2P2NDU3_RHIMU